MEEPRPDQWKHWTPAAQEKAAEALRQRAAQNWRPFYCPNPQCDGKVHGEWTWPHARADQRPPLGDDWLTWLVRGGRGGGKTRTGSEWTNRIIKVAPRLALIAPTGPDARDIMVEGESGILATAKPENRPTWEPSKRKLTWPNGAVGHTFSGEEPDRLRGPQHHAAWIDEPAHIPLIEEIWSNLLFGLRLGKRPRICATTTPVPSKWMKELVKEPDTISVVASTYANIDNLAPQFAATILKRYEGTRKGRQEIYGEILADVDGALWQWEDIDGHRVTLDECPTEFDRIVVGIDPAGSTGKKPPTRTPASTMSPHAEARPSGLIPSWRYTSEGWFITLVRNWETSKTSCSAGCPAPNLPTDSTHWSTVSPRWPRLSPPQMSQTARRCATTTPSETD
jgi:hypothetical protein